MSLGDISVEFLTASTLPNSAQFILRNLIASSRAADGAPRGQREIKPSMADELLVHGNT